MDYLDQPHLPHSRYGKRPIIETPAEFEVIARDYFQRCEDARRPITLAGLALALGFSNRNTIYDYRHRKPIFRDVVEWALLVVEEFTSTQLYNSKSVNVSGPIFMLKNMGYTDKDANGGQQVNVIIKGIAAKL